jgi:hypothetical protein
MKRTLIIHGCWAVAAIAAFSLGSRTAGPFSGDRSTATGQPGDSRSSALAGESGPDARSNRSRDQAAGDRATSGLENAFGSIASASKNLDRLAEQALRDPSPITRRLAFSRLLEALTPENAAEIRSKLVALGADGDQWRDFHYSWGAISGKAAFDHAATSDEPDLAATMTGWAAANPTDALAMLAKLPPEMQGQRDELTASIVSGLSHRDPNMATDLVLRLGQEGNGRAGDLMEIVANETLRSKGPEQASQWAESLPDGPLKGTAMGRIAETYARKDPVAAAKWAQRFADKDYASRSIEQIGGRWAQSDPVAAVGWLESLPAGSGQTAGLRNAFGDWEDRDPAAAGEYLLAMPQSAQRDSAISGFATGYAWQNPQLAIAWAQDIRDPSLRESSLTRAGQAYFRRDPDGARTWLATSGLPAEAQQQITTPNNRR